MDSANTPNTHDTGNPSDTPDPAQEEQDRLDEIRQRFQGALEQDTLNAVVEEAPSVDDFADDSLLPVGVLQRMGFTRTAIQKFLTPEPHPEVMGAEPAGKGVSPERFYSVEEVKKALNDPMVKAWLQKSKERRAKMETVKQENIRLALGQEISVERISLRSILISAVNKYNDDHHREIRFSQATPLRLDTTDPSMIGRVNHMAVQSIRHELTNYDAVWRMFRNKPGGQEAWEIIVLKTAVVIKQAYPQLARYVDKDAFRKTERAESRREAQERELTTAGR